MQSSDGQAWKGVVYLCLNVIVNVRVCMCLCISTAVGGRAVLYSIWRCRMCLFVCLFVYDCARVCVHICVHWQQQAGVLCSTQYGGVVCVCLFVFVFVYDCVRVCVCVHTCVHWQQQAGVLCSIQFGGRWRRQWTDSPLSRTPPPPHRTSPEPAPAHAGNESNPPKKSQENQAVNKSG